MHAPISFSKTGVSKQLGLAMETEEVRSARLENDVATKRLRLTMETDKVGVIFVKGSPSFGTRKVEVILVMVSPSFAL